MAEMNPQAENKTDVEVLIGGKVYTLSGYESEEYLQRIATYLNGKIAELEAMDGYSRLAPDIQTVLLEINLADDYFKQQSKNERLKDETTGKEKDLYDIKHELISTQIKLENAEAAMKKLTEEKEEASRKVFELQTKLDNIHTSQRPPQNPQGGATGSSQGYNGNTRRYP